MCDFSTPSTKRKTPALDVAPEPSPKTQKTECSESDLRAILHENNLALHEQQSKFLADLDKKFGATVDSLRDTINSTTATAKQNENEIKSNQLRITELEGIASTSKHTSADLEERLARLEGKADKSERNLRRNDIIISNILCENPNSVDWYNVIARIGHHLRVEICNTDITFLKLLNNDNRLKNLKETDPVAPPGWFYSDILVKFSSSSTKSNLFKAYMAEKNLSNCHTGLNSINARVYINDNLTIVNFGIYKKANALFKVKNNLNVKKLVKSVYIYRGQVYVKPHNSTMGILISSTDQLLALHAEILNKLQHPQQQNQQMQNPLLQEPQQQQNQQMEIQQIQNLLQQEPNPLQLQPIPLQQQQYPPQQSK